MNTHAKMVWCYQKVCFNDVNEIFFLSASSNAMCIASFYIHPSEETEGKQLDKTEIDQFKLNK